MRAVGSVYHGENFKAVALYNEYADIYSALPRPMTGSHVMHVKYSYSNKNGSIDIYLPQKLDLRNIKKKKDLYSNNNEALASQEVFDDHNVRIECAEDIRFSELERDLIHMAALDISGFCRTKPNIKTFSTINFPDEIIPTTKIRYINPEYLLQPGKSEFVPSCLLQANLDFSYGCVTGFVPGKNASFKDDVFKGFYHDKFVECDYCYAMDKHKLYPKAFVKIDKKKLYEELVYGKFEDFNDKIVGKRISTLRLGKRTEAGAIYNRPQLVDTLETCIDAKVKHVIFPTKFLEYDSGLVNLLKDSKTQLLYSVGFDDLETGAARHGKSNAERIEQAILYREKGVDASIYLMCDLTQPLSTGNSLFIKEMLSKNVPVQLLGARVTSKDLAVRMTGRTWDNLKQHHTQQTFDGEIVGGYVKTGQNELSPEIIHPNILKTIADNKKGNVRLCHHNTQTTWCGACFMHDGFTTETVKPKLTKIKRYNRKPKEHTGKLGLEFD